MARKIIIQERLGEPSDFNFKFVLWADVPAARQSFYADVNKTTTVKDALAAELLAIRQGQILEKQNSASFPAGTTGNQIKTDLIAKFNQFQSEVNSLNPWQFYGTFWDGTIWTNAGAI